MFETPQFVISKENLLKLITDNLSFPLKNDYLIMRHPKANTNVNKVLHSDCSRDSEEYSGINSIGYKQLEDCIVEILSKLQAGKELIIATSPLIRCKNAGEIIQKGLSKHAWESELLVDHALLDRFWSGLEGKNEVEWLRVRDADLGKIDLLSVDPEGRLESQKDFFLRIINLIKEYEASNENKQILFLTHCDALQVLNSVLGKDVKTHYSEHSEFRNAELKLFVSIKQGATLSSHQMPKV